MLTFDSLFRNTTFGHQLRILSEMTLSRPSSSPGSKPSSAPETTQYPAKSLIKRKRHRRIHRPAKDSVYHLLQKHSGVSLFVRPICWTDLHSELLGAQWVELSPCDTPLPASIPGSPPTKGHLQPSRTIITLSDGLTQILQPEAVHPVLCTSAVRTILSTLWPEAFGKPMYLPELHIYFGGRVYRDAVRTQIMYNFPSAFKTVSTQPAESFSASVLQPSPSPTSLPMVCYISKIQLANVRRNLFRVAPRQDGKNNEVIARLQELRSKQLIPSNLDHDAHFVAIFLAMAQKHFYNSPPGGTLRRDVPMRPDKTIPPCPNFEDVTLRLLTHDPDTAEFIVYTAYVTAKFLQRFHDPFKTPRNEKKEVPGIRIEYTRVPIWPILGLRERLGKAMGHDVVGHFDPEDIERWEQDEEEEKENKKSKRKRETLSGVFNDSFEEESDDELMVSSKKRCIREGVPIGMVR